MTEHSQNDHGSESETGKRRKPTSSYRKLRRQLSKTSLRIPHIWLRHHRLRPSDVFFASYPRSGATWSRFVLYEILSGRPSGFAVVNAEICGVGKHAKASAFLPREGRLIATHEQYRKEYKRAIYVVRDARDVALSEFAYTRALEFFRGDLDQFLETFLCKKISPFGPWQRHVASWLDSPIAGTENLLVLRYEDLRQDPLAGVSRMVEFLGVDADKRRIEQALANNSLEKMKSKERIEPQRASLKDRFVRDGLIAGWQGKFTPGQRQFIEQHAGSILQRLGYPVGGAEAYPQEKNEKSVLAE